MIKLIQLENHPCTYGTGWEVRNKGKVGIGKFFDQVNIWKQLLLQRYCIVCVDLDKHQNEKTEAYNFFRWQSEMCQQMMMQQTGLSPIEIHDEYGYLVATSLLEIN